MKLTRVRLKNFRAFKNQVEVDIDDFTAIIGKNDIGKSCLMDALAIFFENKQVKVDRSDKCVFSEDCKDFEITCEFSISKEDQIVLDSTIATAFDQEYLVTRSGTIVIKKTYSCTTQTPKPSISLIAYHPTNKAIPDLLSTKQNDLKLTAEKLGVDLSDVDLRSNPALRKAIWRHVLDKKIETIEDREVSLNEEDGKKIWSKILEYLPIFALFKSDRSSSDEDNEAQDPMKIAVEEAISEKEDDLSKIEEFVKKRVLEVANRTVEELKGIDAHLANTLIPEFKSDPKWNSLFKLTLNGDAKIPINKRGSGIRRLILLSFFQAEAKRQLELEQKRSVIYAIEEPETSLHPDNQKRIVTALLRLSEVEKHQVIVTTHVPGLAEIIPVENFRYIGLGEDNERFIKSCDEETIQTIVKTLGIFPNATAASAVKVLICLEGKTDVAFLKHVSAVMNAQDNELPNLNNNDNAVIIGLGGSNLKEWVDCNYLKALKIPEFHIYDRDTDSKYEESCKKVNSRNDKSMCLQTKKRELENYLHKDVIKHVLGVSIEVDDDMDVCETIRKKQKSDSQKEMNHKNMKRKLAEEGFERITIEMLDERKATDEIKHWLSEIGTLMG